jgi:hypothetical protein
MQERKKKHGIARGVKEEMGSRQRHIEDGFVVRTEIGDTGMSG